jgi:hypothetical protein
MSVSDFYNYRSGFVNVSSAAATPLLSVYGTAAKRLWATGCRVKIGVTAAAAGNEVTFQLCRPAATNTGTGLASAQGVNDFSAPASIGQLATAWSTAPTVGSILAEWVVPQTTGSAWTEFPPTNEEWGIPAVANGNANAGVHIIVTCSVATLTPISVELAVSE